MGYFARETAKDSAKHETEMRDAERRYEDLKRRVDARGTACQHLAQAFASMSASIDRVIVNIRTQGTDEAEQAVAVGPDYDSAAAEVRTASTALNTALAEAVAAGLQLPAGEDIQGTIGEVNKIVARIPTEITAGIDTHLDVGALPDRRIKFQAWGTKLAEQCRPA